MVNQILIQNAKIVNEGVVFEGDVLIEDEFTSTMNINQYFIYYSSY